MAWNTRINYTGTDTIGTGFANGIGNDLRTWGSNVNAGGYNLSNLGTVVTAGPVDVTSPIIARPTTTPGTPGVSSEGKMYVKGGKLIVQYNDAGTVRYKYLDLTGTGVTWVATTVAP
jgi:hypothetical protein